MIPVDSRAKPRRRGRIALASALAGVLVLGGATAALAATGVLGSWIDPPKPAAQADLIATEPEPAERQIRFEERWDLVAEVPHEQFAEPVAIDGAILFESRPGGDVTVVRLIDASDGEELWVETPTMSRCVPDPASVQPGRVIPARAVCVLTRGLGQGPTDIVVLSRAGVESRATIDASASAMRLDGDDVVLRDSQSYRGERVIRVTRSGDVSPAEEDSHGLLQFGASPAESDTAASARFESEQYDPAAISRLVDQHSGAAGVLGLWDVSGGVLMKTTTCDQCDAAAAQFRFFEAVDVEVSATAVPAGIPGCPSGTELLAWAEFADGWVLICGVDVDHPSYAAVLSPGEPEPLLSRGAAQPTGQEALSVVRWDDHLQRYSAELADGSLVILEEDTGTVTVWEGAEHESDRALERWVYRIFLPWKHDAPREYTASAASSPTSSGSDPGGTPLAIPTCAEMNPELTRITGSTPATLAPADASIFGPVVRSGLQGASAQVGCEWRSGEGSAMQWVSVITPEQKNAVIDGMLDFGYRAETDGPQLRVAFTQDGEHHTHLFEGDAWVFIFQSGVEGDFSTSARDALRAANPGRG